MTGLRAASLGVPFEPIPGIRGTDLPATADLRTVKDPWTGEEGHLRPPLRPPRRRGGGPPPLPRGDRAPGRPRRVPRRRGAVSVGPPEIVAVTLARLLRGGEGAGPGGKPILAALAPPPARRLHAPGLRHVAIGGGLDAAPATLPRSSSGPGWLTGSPVVLSNVDVYQLALKGLVDVMLLGCVQVDARGRVNSTVIGAFDRPKVRLPGGGGAAVLFQVVRRIIVYRTRHDPRSLGPAVDFVTATRNPARV